MALSWTFISPLLLLLTWTGPSNEAPPMIHAPHEKPVEGELRLVRFDRQSVPGTGNVMIYHNERWGSVCDDGWNLLSAHVVCKSLGYPHALGYTTQSHFGRPSEELGNFFFLFWLLSTLINYIWNFTRDISNVGLFLTSHESKP